MVFPKLLSEERSDVTNDPQIIVPLTSSKRNLSEKTGRLKCSQALSTQHHLEASVDIFHKVVSGVRLADYGEDFGDDLAQCHLA